MPRFKHYNYDQDSMVVINYQEQLQPGTFVSALKPTHLPSVELRHFF